MAGLLYLCSLDAGYMSHIYHNYTKEELIESCQHPVMIHYLTAFYNRPWFTPCTHPYKEEYFKYKYISPWKDMKEKYSPLPIRIRAIDWCYRHIGLRKTEMIRIPLKLINIFKN